MSEQWRKCDVGGRALNGVREKREHGERSLERALSALASALNGVAAPWMVIGGIAVIARGVRRMTTDIDAVVPGDAMPVEALLRAFKKCHILSRIKDAKAFAHANLVLLLRHSPTGVDLDVSLAWTRFELEALEGREMARYGRVLAPMATPEDLVIFKAMASRPKDVEDATALLVMHRGINLARVRRNLRELSLLAEEPSLSKGLEAIIALARQTTPQRKPASKAPTAKSRAGTARRRKRQ